MNDEPGFDVEKEIAYWRDLAFKDLQFAGRLIAREEEEMLYRIALPKSVHPLAHIAKGEGIF